MALLRIRSIIVVMTVLVTSSFAALSPMTMLNIRIGNLERSMGSFRTITNSLSQRIINLERQNQAQRNQMSAMESASNMQMEQMARDNVELRQKNAELQTMLATFERFFGSLLVENPEAFDPTVNAIERMDTLNAFLGNKEAYLAELRPDPVTVPANNTVDQEQLGRALAELSEVNGMLNQQVTKLQKRVDAGVVAAGERSITGGTSDIVTIDEVSTRLMRVEALVNTLVSSKLDNQGRLASGSNDIISEGDRAILEGAVYGARGVTSVRKSVFSVASTQSQMGTTEAQKIVFSHIHVDKGRHWNSENNTFVCAITGYYFFHATFRSYDGRYMGVTLMKNDEAVSAIYTEESSRNVMESQAVILPLRVGDTVWMRLAPSTTFAVNSDPIYKYCTFNGFLVYKGL